MQIFVNVPAWPGRFEMEVDSVGAIASYPVRGSRSWPSKRPITADHFLAASLRSA